MPKAKSNCTLLIWEQIPESVELYVIPPSETEILAHVRKAHGSYINSTTEPPDSAYIVSDMIGDPKNADEDTPEKLRGALRPFKADDSEGPLTVPVYEVVRCGFLL